MPKPPKSKRQEANFTPPRTYSALHANIQEYVDEAGVEIMSPKLLALRHLESDDDA